MCVWSFGPYMAAKERVGLGALVYQEIRGSQPVLLTLRETVVARKEVKGTGEMERHIHLNAEFQRIARRSERAFLSDQCKEIEENTE